MNNEDKCPRCGSDNYFMSQGGPQTDEGEEFVCEDCYLKDIERS